eukprot:TRINITY_DN10607_c0_g1_i1.p2 TRINITY_DN10607_c0_g1~~TRINITY_DN10607_c0_g1_i1.p2  ORF type:complete len:125 (+),score=72.79 TRINITY_DN10607_c0_g1_i1:82-456(+)
MGCGASQDAPAEESKKNAKEPRTVTVGTAGGGPEEHVKVQTLTYDAADLDDFEEELQKDAEQQERDKEAARLQEEQRKRDEAAEREQWEREMQQQEREDALEQRKLESDLESGKIKQDIFILDS